MKTTTKRLLSILLAAVLALTVAMAANLPTQAATAEEITAAVTAANKETADAEARYQKAVAAVKTLAAEAENSTNGLPTCTTCPFCGVQNITWVGAAGKLTEQKSTSKTNNHIYLTGDVTVAAAATFATTNNARYTSCVFTNGYNITGEQTYVFFAGNGILNVIAMDQTGEKHSVIQGANTGEAAGATVHSNGGGTTTQAHFYGGIYQKLNPATTANVFGGAGNSGNYLLYHTTVKAGTNGSAIYINGENGYYSNWVTMYSGTIDGSKTSDYTVHIEAGRAIAASTKNESAYTAEFRMYGGDVIGGGNSTVYMEKTPTYATTYGARGSIFSMYGGSISGGSAGSYGGNVYIAGSYTVTASASTNYKETTYTTIPVFNMYGGTISGGEAGKAATTPVTIQDLKDLRAAGGTETSINDDGTAGYGGNIYAGAGSQVTIGGNANIKEGKTYAKKTVSYSESKDTYSASIAGGGGNVYATGASTTLNILGGTVENGWTDGCGGNIYLLSGTGEIAAGVQVLNGKAYPSEQSGAGGGNIYLSGSGAELTTAGDILDGYVKGVSSAGGNLNVGAGTTLNVTGGKIGNGVIESSRTNGKRGGAWGANIRAWNANVNISGGTIYGGRQYDYMADGELLEKRELVAQTSSNVGCLGDKVNTHAQAPKLHISGDAVIVGDIGTTRSSTTVYTSVKLSGSPKIVKEWQIGDNEYTAIAGGLQISGNENAADISELNAEADICVTGANNRVLTAAREDVAQLVTCFKPYYSSNCIRPNTSNQLVYYTSHSYDGGVITTEPACEATGVKTFTCGCTKTKTETVDALGHNYTAPTFAWAEDYTCQATWGCKNCDETWSDACVVTAEVTKAATCYETGEEKYTAAITVDETNYTESKTKVLTTVAHTPAVAVREEEVAATCYAEGSYYEVVYCSVEACKEELSRTAKTIEKTAHTPADAVQENVKEATCTAEGSCEEVVYCSVAECKKEISRETKTLEKLPHTGVFKEEVEAGCLEMGYAAHYACTACSNWFEDADCKVPMSQQLNFPLCHALTEVEEKTATCQETGISQACFYCSQCEKYYTENDDKTAYETAIDPVTPVVDHSFTEYAQSSDAKPGVNAQETAFCDYGCGETDTRDIAGTALPEKAVASIGTSYFETVAEALENAAENDTVTLVADADEAGAVLVVMNGVTLDLNGHTLTAEYLITTSGGANIQDASNGKGLLKVAKDQLTVVDIKQLPIWKEDEQGFRFVSIDMEAWLPAADVENGTATVGFYFKGNDPEYLLTKELLDGPEDGDGIVVQMRMYFTNKQGSQSVLTFNVPVDVLKDYAGKYGTDKAGALGMNISGLNTISDISFQAVVAYGNAEILSNTVEFAAK